jgi:uncharacterized damage-inducible protein DinB
MRTRSERLSETLVQTVTGPMWHGPALAEHLHGVSYQQAASRPVAGAHTIWELVLHVAAWAQIARARLQGERTGDPTPEQDWPAQPEPTAESWATALEGLSDSHRLLAADAASIDDRALDLEVATLDYTVETLLRGVVEHGTYHGGQIALLKRASGS